jgi:hypothetical protein
MKTTNNGIKIPDNPNSSSDNIADIITAIITNGNAIDTMNGNISSIQTDYNQGYIKLSNGLMIQWGHPSAVKMTANGQQVQGHITFPTSFPHVCLTVVGSDAGGYGMAFGFYALNKIGCTWCTCVGLGIANWIYSPNYIAFGF